MCNYYSSDHSYARRSSDAFMAAGEREKAAAWQITQRAWFQHRAMAMGIEDAILDTFGLSQAMEAHGMMLATDDE